MESTLAAKFSDGEFGTRSPVSSLTIAIQGRSGTILTALEGMRRGIPLLVVNGSGMAANVITYALNLSRSHPGCTETGLMRCILDEFGWSSEEPEYRECCTLLREMEAHMDKVFVYEVDFFGHNTVALDVAILDCILSDDTRRAMKMDSTHWLCMRPESMSAEQVTRACW